MSYLTVKLNELIGSQECGDREIGSPEAARQSFSSFFMFLSSDVLEQTGQMAWVCTREEISSQQIISAS